jgi:hypothetical protein
MLCWQSSDFCNKQRSSQSLLLSSDLSSHALDQGLSSPALEVLFFLGKAVGSTAVK